MRQFKMQGGQLRAARGIYGDNFKMQGGQLRTELLVMLILLPNSKHSICHCETVQADPRNKTIVKLYKLSLEIS